MMTKMNVRRPKPNKFKIYNVKTGKFIRHKFWCGGRRALGFRHDATGYEIRNLCDYADFLRERQEQLIEVTADIRHDTNNLMKSNGLMDKAILALETNLKEIGQKRSNSLAKTILGIFHRGG